MNWFFSLVTAISVSSIFIGGLFILSPSGQMSKPLRYIYSLCFIMTILVSSQIKLNKTDVDFNFQSPETADYTDIEIAVAEYTYGLALKNAGISFSKITVFTNNSENESISISKVLVYSDDDKQRIISALGGENKKIEVEVINE